MPDAVAVLVPLVSANEPDAQVVSVDVVDGAEVAAGTVLAVVENTKSAVDVVAESGGFIVGLAVAEDDQVTAGDLVCWIAPDPGWEPPAPEPSAATDGANGGTVPAGLRISEPALELARARGLDLALLPVGPLVTSAMVEQIAARGAGQSSRFITTAPPPVPLTDTGAVVVLGGRPTTGGGHLPVAIYGGGGHGAQCIDLVRGLDGPEPACVLDDGLPAGSDVLGVEVLGGAAALHELTPRGIAVAVNAVGGIAAPASRARVFDLLVDAGLTLAVLIHPAAWVEPSALVAPGAQVFAHAYVGSRAAIGAGAIVNTSAVVSHDCVLGPCANVSPGALLAGGVEVAASALVGMGVTVNVGVRIGEGARIGNGATVKSDVPDGGVVRANESWPR